MAPNTIILLNIKLNHSRLLRTYCAFYPHDDMMLKAHIVTLRIMRRIYSCIYIYIYIYIYICVCVCMYTFVCLFVCLFVCVCVFDVHGSVHHDTIFTK